MIWKNGPFLSLMPVVISGALLAGLLAPGLGVAQRGRGDGQRGERAGERGPTKADFIVERYDPQRVFNGTTIFADNSREGRPRIVEVNMRGEVVWEYSPPVRGAKKDSTVMDVNVLPNDNVLFILRYEGLFEVTRSGEVVWSRPDPEASHDVDRLPNGNTIYVRGWVGKGQDHVVEVNREGKTVWTWNGLAQFDKPPYADIHNQGWIHVNAVTRLENGHTLISLRNFHAVVEVNPRGDVVWSHEFKGHSRTGFERDRGTPGAHPHDPELVSNDRMLVAIPTSHNVIYEIDRRSGNVVWEWRHPEGASGPMHMRDANRLPNGNTLIVEAEKIVEVAPSGEIIWQLRAPSINRHFDRLVKYLYKAQRIGADKRVFGD